VFLLKGFAFGKYTYNGPRKNVTEDNIPYTYLGFKQRPDNIILKLCDELLSFIRLIICLFSMIPDRKFISLFVYSSDAPFTLPISLFAKLLGIKISKFVAEIVDKSEFDGSIFRKLKRYEYNFNFKYLNKRADKLIVFSYYLKNEFLKMGYNEKNIIVQPNLTDFKYWETSGGEIKYDLGYSGAPYLKDGLYDLFKAMSLLSKEKIHVTLLVIGDATFGKSLIPALKVECQKLGISKNVTFIGLVESFLVKKYLSECKILAITRPSTIQTRAGFPTKLGEYYATRRPVLATNFGDMNKYFTDGQDIVMAECGNPESIAQKILWMLQNSQELDLIALRGYEKAYNMLEYKNSVLRMINSLDSNLEHK
jgi:glycosyltransferase involved in cell wall biosynthesis